MRLDHLDGVEGWAGAQVQGRGVIWLRAGRPASACWGRVLRAWGLSQRCRGGGRVASAAMGGAVRRLPWVAERGSM